MVKFEADLFVIGGGSGGVRAARIAASHGANVMLAEEYRMGGTCVIRGCVPKKLFVIGSHIRDEIMDAAGFGWKIGSMDFNWPTLIANKDREIARLEEVYSSNLTKAGVRVVRSRAVLIDKNIVRLDSSGETVAAKHVLIATGSKPYQGPTIPGIEHAISSNDAFNLDRLPSRLVIQGSGYIALEFACIFAGFGCEVTIVCRSNNILRGFDDDIRAHVRAEMEERGIRFKTLCVVDSIERRGDEFLTQLSDHSAMTSDKVMFAMGRVPNVEGLGLETVGVELNPSNGGIAVDAWSRTSTEGIYAVGDVTHRINLTPVAIREGHAFADTVFGRTPVKVDHDCIPTAVFSQPEVATVGLTEAEARADRGVVHIYKTAFRPMKATMSGRRTRMFMKLVVDGSSDRVLGCHISGENAAEIIQGVSIAIKMRATKADFDATFALHPTAAEELVTLRSRS